MPNDQKISGLTAVTTLDTGDLIEVVDISDTTMAASGTNKKITFANLRAATGNLGGDLYMHANLR